MIRPACPDDIAALLPMVTALAAHHGDPCHATPKTLQRDLFSGWAEALIDDAGRGYAALVPRLSLQNGVRGMDMHHLYVAPDARGTGLGSALIDACIARARALGCSFLLVGTHPDNTAAQSFYLKRGFEARSGAGPQFRLTLRPGD